MASLPNFIARFLRRRGTPIEGRCRACGGARLRRRLATYPAHLNGPLKGRRVDVYRVELDQCRDCGHLMPTPEGQAKIKRCVKVGKRIIRKSIQDSFRQRTPFG